MAILFSHDFSGLAPGATIAGVSLNNSRGGSGSRTWTQRGAQTVVGAASGGGFVSSAPTTVNFSGGAAVQTPKNGINRWMIDQSGGNLNSYSLSARQTGAGTNTERFQLTSTPTQELVRQHAGGTFNNLNTNTTYTRSSANIQLELDVDPRYGVISRVKSEDGTTTLYTSNGGAIVTTGTPPIPNSTWSIGAFESSNQPQTSKFMWYEFDDGASGTAPVLASSTSTKTGKYTANITTTISAAGVGGEIWYYVSTVNTPPADFDEISADPTKYQVISALGAQTIPVTGLLAGTTYYAWILARNATRARSAVTAAGSFTTDPAFAAPVIQSANVVALGGRQVRVTVVPASGSGPIEGVTVALPVDTTPNGAVAKTATAATLSGGNWVVTWNDVVPGNYSNASVVASNIDNPMVTASGDKKVKIIQISGSAQA